VDHVVEPADSLKENPRVEGHRCNGSGAVEAADEPTVHPATHGQAMERLTPTTTRQSDQTFRQLVEVDSAFGPQILPPDDDDQGVNRESLTLAARPDIEAAMVLALRSTIVTHGSHVPGKATQDRDQLAPVRPCGNQAASTDETRGLVGRPDIDAAMVLALRNTMVTKNDVPMHGYLVPDQNLVDTANPPGER
jgi:hypothetical protein